MFARCGLWGLLICGSICIDGNISRFPVSQPKRDIRHNEDLSKLASKACWHHLGGSGRKKATHPLYQEHHGRMSKWAVKSRNFMSRQNLRNTEGTANCMYQMPQWCSNSNRTCHTFLCSLWDNGAEDFLKTTPFKQEPMITEGLASSVCWNGRLQIQSKLSWCCKPEKFQAEEGGTISTEW